MASAISVAKWLLNNDCDINNIPLEALLDLDELSGVERGYFDGENHISFILNGISFTATEDPDDGYRSAMRSLTLGKNVENTFPPIKVSLSMSINGYLVVMDVVSKETILEVGTDFSDDWYPYYVDNWHPEKMHINKGVV